jgi:predicted SnoaL-like aldol condensation-catalyzing enzyme
LPLINVQESLRQAHLHENLKQLGDGLKRLHEYLFASKQSQDKALRSAEYMTKKDIAVSFLELASSGKVREAFEKCVHVDFFHHNPYFKGDRESLVAGMEDCARKFPNKVFEPVRTLEDGDLVAVHGKVRIAPGGPEISLVQIFRFEGDRIIEEWEAGQEVPKESPNEYGMF